MDLLHAFRYHIFRTWIVLLWRFQCYNYPRSWSLFPYFSSIWKSRHTSPHPELSTLFHRIGGSLVYDRHIESTLSCKTPTRAPSTQGIIPGPKTFWKLLNRQWTGQFRTLVRSHLWWLPQLWNFILSQNDHYPHSSLLLCASGLYSLSKKVARWICSLKRLALQRRLIC